MHVAAQRAASRTGRAEVRVFISVFVIAAITTTVLGMGGPLAFPAIRETLGLEPASVDTAAGWGEIRWVHVASRVRAARTTNSDVVGTLSPGDSVRVDFAGAGWYAVFPSAATEREEGQAIGYVFGKLLKDIPPRIAAGGSTAGSGGS